MPKFLSALCIALFLLPKLSFASNFVVIEDLIENALVWSDEKQILIPWDGGSTNQEVFTHLDGNLENGLLLSIVHPAKYSLFIEGQLFYYGKRADTFSIELRELRKISYSKSIRLKHFSKPLNAHIFKARILNQKEISEADILKSTVRNEPEFSGKYYLLLFVVIFGIIRFVSRREFEFYFSGEYFRSPKLTIEKFLGDSLNPFYILLSVILLGIFIYRHITNLSFLDYIYESALGVSLANFWFKIVLILGMIMLYLISKWFLYRVYTWMNQDLRNFPALWKTYLLTFSNLSFWLFLLAEIPVLLSANLELGNYFRILFFIFAALNAVGGIMTNLNFKLKSDLITVCGILAIDVFPIILLVHLLTF